MVLALCAVGGLAVAYVARPGPQKAFAQLFDPFGLDSGAPVSIPRREILDGARMDGIPALTDPEFVTAAEATWLAEDDRVIGLVHRGVAKAYPTKILLWHEAVNDTVGGKPYLVTF